MRTASLLRFGSEDRGATGAEKALVACFALAVIVLGGTLVSRGSQQAAGDAERALASGAAGAGAMGEVVKPLGSGGELATANGGRDASALSTSLVSFSSDYQGAAPEAPPPDGPGEPAPKAAAPPARPQPRPTLERDIVTDQRDGRVRAVSMTRLGLLPRSDAVLRALRDALGNQDIDPASAHGVIRLWRAEDGGSASVDPRGTVAIDLDRGRGGGRGVVIFRDGAFLARTPTANMSYDSEGRLTSYTILGRSGATVFAAGSYRFTYGEGGQPSRVEVTGGPHAGTWTRGPDGTWTNERGARFAGADGPATWAGTLGQQVRLAGISAAALEAIDGEMSRVRAIWRQYAPDADGLGLTTLRNVIGSGFSGNAGAMQRLSTESTAITTELRELRALQGRIEGGSDPVEIARQARDFSRRAEALRDRIDRFRDDSARVVGQSMRAGRAWAIAKDVYGLGTAGGVKTGLWNLGNLIKDVVGP